MYGLHTLFQALKYQAFVDFGYLMLLIYFIAMALVTSYCLLQFHLLYLYKRFHRENPKITYRQYEMDDPNIPFVTVQLPMFNEMYVAERIIDCVVQQEYPKDKFEIHVLDDSTDETVEIVAKKVAEYKALGFNIEHIHRVNRQGYKAGALQEAMPRANGEYIAIFDADFTPRTDFLRKTMPYFEDEKVGIVQTRWEHINANQSMITRMQALQLNVHFTVEQAGRSYGNLLLQFNGTAGVWRKKVIGEAGGWQSDTLTEDLDLSFRAQIMGYKIQYLEKLESPAELPIEMNALKGQQFRWNKGGAQNSRKLIKLIWNTDKLNFIQKTHAISQLLAYGVFLYMFVAGLSSIPLAFAFSELGISTHFLSFSVLGLFSVAAISYTANITAALRETAPTLKEKLQFFGLFFSFMPISLGLSLYNTIAVIEGYMGKASSFVRTPKYGAMAANKDNSFKKASYTARKISWVTYAEGLMALIFLTTAIIGAVTGNGAFVLFHSMLAFGFGTICYYSIKHLRYR
ncbi:MAG: glycosyltransferase family 2 protein [Chitinophagales bacterium]|jgi:cellulose synthase/poly-beta-1,6-N-acetylglucosamine synthase-like glycosyltransferase|nr:glycosyltransferase family 2 protein [Chitinophagales bacterium]